MSKCRICGCDLKSGFITVKRTVVNKPLLINNVPADVCTEDASHVIIFPDTLKRLHEIMIQNKNIAGPEAAVEYN